MAAHIEEATQKLSIAESKIQQKKRHDMGH
jgi:hypothetical protein